MATNVEQHGAQQELQVLPTPDVSHYNNDRDTNSLQTQAVVEEKKYEDNDINTVSAEDIMNAFSDEIGASDGEIINNLSCCLSFLLSGESPLWKANKTTHSIQPSIDLDNGLFDGNNNNETNKERLKFISRCSNWQSNYKIDLQELPHVQYAQSALNTLPTNDGRDVRWPKLMEFWNSWRKYENLEEDYKIEQLDWTQDDINAIRANVNLLLDGSPGINDLNEVAPTYKPKSESVNLASLCTKNLEPRRAAP